MHHKRFPVSDYLGNDWVTGGWTKLPERGCARLRKDRSLPFQRSVWLAKRPYQRSRNARRHSLARGLDQAPRQICDKLHKALTLAFWRELATRPYQCSLRTVTCASRRRCGAEFHRENEKASSVQQARFSRMAAQRIARMCIRLQLRDAGPLPTSNASHRRKKAEMKMFCPTTENYAGDKRGYADSSLKSAPR